MSQPFVSAERFAAALTYAEYQQVFEQAAAAPETETTAPEEFDRLQTTQLNRQRSRRIAKTYQVSAELRAALEAIEIPQRWLVITEPWCGDSAQNLPYLAIMAAASPHIELRVLLRDRNLDLMDHYLTGGKRSIPILVAGDAEGREIFRWGPRPREAAALFDDLKAAGAPKEQMLEKLHLWYGRNRGQAIDAELRARLAAAGIAAPAGPSQGLIR